MRSLRRLAEVADAPAGLVGGLAVAVWLIWAQLAGGFFATRWGLLGAFLVAALALNVAAVPIDPAARTGWRTAMLVLLATFVAWNLLTIAWADFPGEAWTGTAKTALYAASFAIFALWAWSPRAMRAVLAVLALGVGALALGSIVQAAAAADPSAELVDGRLLGSVEYVNGSVVVWMTGFWPALYLAVSPRGPLLLRAGCLAAAGAITCACVLGGSRGWLYVLPLAVAAYVALARQRLRALGGLLLVAVATAPAVPTLLDVADRVDDGLPAQEPLDRAALATFAVVVALGVAGAAWTALDRAVRLSPAVHRALAAAVAALLATAFVGATAATAVAADDPRGWISARWDDFTAPEFEKGSERLGALGTNRWNEWVVAAREFRAHPLVGIGADNYAAAYLRERESEEFNPRYPHSWPLRLLSQLGLVGTALFVGFAAIAVALALGRRSRGDPIAGGAAGAALTVFVYWALHGSLDWFWEIPAAAAPAFGLLALAGSPQPGTNGAEQVVVRRPSRRVAVGALVLALPICAALLVSWLSAAYQGAGTAVWQRQPATAYARLERAANLNPLTAEPLVVAGIVATKHRDYGLAQSLFERAADREPQNWYAHLQLGLLAGERGEYAAAEERLARAAELNPRDSRIRFSRGLVQRRARVDPRAINARFAPDERPAPRGVDG